jgi:hypothetical protein
LAVEAARPVAPAQGEGLPLPHQPVAAQQAQVRGQLLPVPVQARVRLQVAEPVLAREQAQGPVRGPVQAGFALAQFHIPTMPMRCYE